MKKISVKYKVDSFGFISNVIVSKQHYLIEPYDYPNDFLANIDSAKKIDNFIKHLEDIKRIKL